MSEEQSPTGKGGASADAQRWTHPMGRASLARFYVGTDLTRIVDQVTFAARSPVLEAVSRANAGRSASAVTRCRCSSTPASIR